MEGGGVVDNWADSDLVYPQDWDKPEHIPDPDAKKPEDWDEEMDGEWEPPVIQNPEYKVGLLLPSMVEVHSREHADLCSPPIPFLCRASGSPGRLTTQITRALGSTLRLTTPSILLIATSMPMKTLLC